MPFHAKLTMQRFWLVFFAIMGFVTASQLPAQTSDREPKKTAVDEQTIYIPYEDLVKVFERDGRGVFLPYEQFQQLWKDAQRARDAQPAGKSFQSLLVAAENEANIQRDLMVVKAKLRVELVGKGWHRVPFQLQDVAIQSAKIEGQTATIARGVAGYELVVEHKSDEAKTIDLELEYAKAIVKSPGQNVVSFAAPQAPINRWSIKIPEPGIKVQIEPMMAGSQNNKADPKTTEITAFLGTAPQVSISWVPKSESAIGMEALASVHSHQTVSIEEGLVRVNTVMSYAIDRSELRELKIEIPKSQKVVNVVHPNVKRWSLEASEKDPESYSKILVELFEPARKSQELTIESEMALPNQAQTSFKIEPIRCLDANRQSGFIGIRVLPSLKLDFADRVGLTQADLAESPETWRGQSWNSIYRYSSIPFQLTCKIEKVKPSIRVTQRVEYFVEVDKLNIELSTQHLIENSGVFQLDFEIPTGYDLLQVKPNPSPGVGDVEIEKFEKSETDPTRWTVSLRKRTQGLVGLWLQMRQVVAGMDLRNPTEKPFELSLEIPKATGEDVQWVEGWAGVYATESLRVTSLEMTNARDTVAPELRSKWQTNGQSRYAQMNEALAFSYSMEKPQVKVAIERRKPFVTHRQWLHAFVDSGAIRYSSTHFIRSQYSAISKWRLDIPQELASEIRVEAPGIRESVITPAPADLREGYVAWELTADTPWVGDREVRLVWQTKIDSLEIGKSVNIEIPVLLARGVDQSFGQVTLHKREGIDLDNIKTMEGLRAIDARYDLFPDVSGRSAGNELPDVKLASSAFEFQGDWRLNLDATRFALQSISTTSIERAYIQATLTRSQQIAVSASYRMKNARQRVSLQLPVDAEFNSQPLRINGVAASLEKGADGVYFIPMSNLDATKGSLVEVSYLVNGKPNSIPLPTFPDEPSIQKVYLEVVMPKEWVLLSTNRRWNEEFEWKTGDQWHFVPENSWNDLALKQWVAEETPANAQAIATDARMRGSEQTFLFSSIRPGKDQDQTFTIKTIDNRWLAGLVLGGFTLLALVMRKSTATSKFTAVAIVISIALAIGFFAPLLSRQLLNYPSLIGAIIAGLLWSGQLLTSVVPRSKTRPSALVNSQQSSDAPVVDGNKSKTVPEAKDSTSQVNASDPSPPGAAPQPDSSDEESSQGGN